MRGKTFYSLEYNLCCHAIGLLGQVGLVMIWTLIVRFRVLLHVCFNESLDYFIILHTSPWCWDLDWQKVLNPVSFMNFVKNAPEVVVNVGSRWDSSLDTAAPITSRHLWQSTQLETWISIYFTFSGTEKENTVFHAPKDCEGDYRNLLRYWIRRYIREVRCWMVFRVDILWNI